MKKVSWLNLYIFTFAVAALVTIPLLTLPINFAFVIYLIAMIGVALTVLWKGIWL